MLKKCKKFVLKKTVGILTVMSFLFSANIYASAASSAESAASVSAAGESNFSAYAMIIVGVILVLGTFVALIFRNKKMKKDESAFNPLLNQKNKRK